MMLMMNSLFILSLILLGPGPKEVTTAGIETFTNVKNMSISFSFTTCSNTGPTGPTQYQCDAAHKTGPQEKVRVISDGDLTGVQVWTVPKTSTYYITALGAGGGKGLSNKPFSSGAYVNAMFNLTKGEEIYILVGQAGQSACEPNDNKDSLRNQICRFGFGNFTMEAELMRNPQTGELLFGGGGGGGGASFVFKKSNETGELIPIVVAGGGGGNSAMLASPELIDGSGGRSPAGDGYSAMTPENGPGAGGGWRGTANYPQGGVSLIKGGVGGQTCAKAKQSGGWQTSGGFGAGGGGCTAGGGGGGYTGGNVSLTDNPTHDAQGGSSYVSSEGENPVLYAGINVEPWGQVEISFNVKCKCESICLYQSESSFTCLCPMNHILASDNLSCISSIGLRTPPDSSNNTINSLVIGLVIGSVILFVMVLIFTIYCVYQRAKKRTRAMRLDALNSSDHQLDRLRQGGMGMMTEYNPNYDFGGPKCTMQDLREIPRDKLTLVRALGQGAFGEVYMGYLTNLPRETTDQPVAVKTLPALCTDEAEMDFLMEALIMSKFHHPNIVRFIGVCFEKHPRYIVLELLEGGDLKTFLRESRPKPNQPSRVTMLDLVKLATDVAHGCRYLEENHFIHRDIAARNCLLTTKGPNRVAKIADFGMARDIYRADYYRKGGKAMLPVKWMPPEAFLDGIFTSKTDVWSFGILLWEVFSLGYMPYPGRGNQEVMQLVTAGGRMEHPQNCPTPVYHIMTLCWHGVPERRATFADIIKKLEQCSQDPEVIHSPLPVFHRPPSVERDTTVMRPKDADRMVLTVDTPKPLVEPDCPNSAEPLIGSENPDMMDMQDSCDGVRSGMDGILGGCDETIQEGLAPAQGGCGNSVFRYNMDGGVANTDTEAQEDSKLLVDVDKEPKLDLTRPSTLPVHLTQPSSGTKNDYVESGMGCSTSAGRRGANSGQLETVQNKGSVGGPASEPVSSSRHKVNAAKSAAQECHEKVPASSSSFPNTHSTPWGIKTNPWERTESRTNSGDKKNGVMYENVRGAPEGSTGTGLYNNTGLGLLGYVHGTSTLGEDTVSRASSSGSEEQDRGDSGIVVDLRKQIRNSQPSSSVPQ